MHPAGSEIKRLVARIVSGNAGIRPVPVRLPVEHADEVLAVVDARADREGDAKGKDNHPSLIENLDPYFYQRHILLLHSP